MDKLEKMQPPSGFPGLGIDNRRETPILTKPEQLATKQHAAANAITTSYLATHDVPERKLPVLRAKALGRASNPRLQGFSRIGPQSTVSYALGGSLRPNASKLHGDLGTQQHEDFHTVIGRLAVKQGWDRQHRLDFANKLFASLPQESRRALDHHWDVIQGESVGNVAQSEEKMSRIYNWLNCEAKRVRYVNKFRKKFPDHDLGNSFMTHDRNMKSAHKALKELMESIGPDHPIVKSEDGLSKARPFVGFPKLGVTNRRETPIINTPRELESKQKLLAHHAYRQNRNPLATDEEAQSMRDHWKRRMDKPVAGRALASDLGSSAYALSDRMRGLEAWRGLGAGRGTKHHEDFHLTLGQLSQKLGWDEKKHGYFAARLFDALPEEHRETLKEHSRVMRQTSIHDQGMPDKHEEVMARCYNYVNSRAERDSFRSLLGKRYKYLDTMEGWDKKEQIIREHDKKMKQAYNHINGLARSLTPDHPMFQGFLKPATPITKAEVDEAYEVMAKVAGFPNTDKLKKKIEFVVDIYTSYLKYRVLGPHALHRKELLELMRRGLVKATDLKKDTIKDTYFRTHLKFLVDESNKEIRERTLKHIESQAGQWIDHWRHKAKNTLMSALDFQVLDAHRQWADPIIRETLKDTFGKKTAQAIAQELRRKTGDLNKDWLRVVNTELANASNHGAADAIVANNKGKAHDQIYCYKVGPNDSKTCNHCRKFWFQPDGVTPKVYSLAELQANGSNFGRKTAEWLPTVGNTHPHERHLLLQLPLGWGFVDGKLEYISRDHNEFKKQRQID